MKRKGWLVVGLVFLPVLAIVLMGARKLTPAYALDNNVNPRIYQPLAVENSWTYIWQNKIISDKSVPNDEKKPTYYCIGFYRGGVFTGAHYLYELKTFRETYKVYRQDQNHFFFNTVCDGASCNEHEFGDGRFVDSVENAWTWTDTTGGGQTNIILTETIKRKTPGTQPGDTVVKIDVDNRNIIHIVKKHNQWAYRGMVMDYGRAMKLDYDFTDHTVEVLAGKFEHCILVKEIYKTKFDGQNLTFTVFKYYAPNVGKVKEYEELADGTIAYTMELEKFKVAP